MKATDTNAMSRLRQKIKHDDRELADGFRKNRQIAVREYVGSNHAAGGPNKHVPVNFCNLMVDVLTLFLAGGTPKVFVDTRIQQRRAFGKKLENAINQLIRRKIRFRESVRRVVKDAIFAMGIMKVGLNTARQVEIGGVLHDVGQVYADPVDPDHFVLDLSAYVREDCLYFSERYRVRREDAQECGLYDPDLIANVPTAQPGPPPDEDRGHSVRRAAHEDGGAPADFEDHIWLMDVYLPKDRLVLTFSCAGGDTQLRVPDAVQFDGPECGPYYLLGYGQVPLSVLPLAPVANVMHLHEELNKIARKIINQAKRQKTITIGVNSTEEDNKAVRDARDGDFLLLSTPVAPQEVSYGGPSQGLLAIFQQFMTLFNYFGYNVEGLGGMRQQASTATQEQMMTGGATRRLSDMAATTEAFTSDVVHGIAWHLWEDQVNEYDLVVPVSGAGFSVPDRWRRNERDGEFPDYSFTMVPYSMQERSPDSEYDVLISIMRDVVMQLVPFMQAAGIQPDVERFLMRVGRLKDIDMSDLVTLTGQVQAMEQAEGPPKPPTTTRNYVRTGQPGPSPQGAAVQMQQNMGNRIPGMAP